MELTTMFLNQLTGKNSVNTASSSNSNKGFEQVLNNVEKKETNNNNYNKITKQNTNKKQDVIANDKKQEKPLEIKKEDNNKVESKEEVKKNETIDKKEVNSNDIEEKEKAIVIDEETLQKLSDILGISTDKILNILSSLSISVSMLEQPEHLIKFLQSAFNVENPSQLLAKDNIKNIMQDITNIAKSIDYQDIINIDENTKDILASIVNNEDVKNIKVLNDNEQIKQEINNLLEQLNGKVVTEKARENIQINNTVDIKSSLTTETKINSENVDVENVENPEVSEEQKQFNQPDNKQMYQQNGEQNANKNSQMLETNKQEISIKQETFNISNVSNNSKVFNASLPKTQVFRNINASDVVAQIMEKIKVSIKPDVSEVKMILKPEQLGEVSLKIATQNGIVTAQFTAESQKVKEIIESNFNQLKDMLAQQGIDVGALEVNVSDKESQNQSFNMFEQNTNKAKTNKGLLLEDDVKIIEAEAKISEEEILDSKVSYSI